VQRAPSPPEIADNAASGDAVHAGGTELADREWDDELGGLLQRAVDARAHPITGPLLQRLVGFEAELMVPSLGPSHNRLTYTKNPGGVTDAIKSFLDGGVPYGTHMGGSSKWIRLDSDHADQISRRPIVDKLKQLGYVTGNPKEPKTKLEVVTTALDELAPESNSEIGELLSDVENLLQGFLGDAKSGDMKALGKPARPGYFTGVPVSDLAAWMGDDYKQIEGLVKEFIDAKTADVVALQATVGVIPSGLRTFLALANARDSKALIEPPSAARKQLLDIVKTVISELESNKLLREDPWVKGLGKAGREAFWGILSLIYSYLLADTLHQTTAGTATTHKNAVPFLIKHGPWDLVRLAGTSEMRKNPPPPELARGIGYHFKQTRFLKVSYWTETGKDSAKGEGLIKKAVQAREPNQPVFDNDYVDVVEAMLCGTTDDMYAVQSGAMLPGMDKLTRDSGGIDVAYESYKQEAIPLEYRWITKYKTTEVFEAMAEIVSHVRQANMRELSQDQQDKVYEAIRKDP
jgi:hypothetical protein